MPGRLRRINQLAVADARCECPLWVEPVQKRDRLFWEKEILLSASAALVKVRSSASDGSAGRAMDGCLCWRAAKMAEGAALFRSARPSSGTGNRPYPALLRRGSGMPLKYFRKTTASPNAPQSAAKPSIAVLRASTKRPPEIQQASGLSRTAFTRLPRPQWQQWLTSHLRAARNQRPAVLDLR